MASRRPSMRSRANHPALANGTSAHHHHHAETEFLIDELRSFRLERFDADRFVESRCQTMSEKGIRSLCAELIRIKKASAEEICQSVYANYGAFIRTSQELSDLEGELLTLRNLLSKQAALVNGLVDGVRLDFFPSARDVASEGVPYCEDYQTLLEDSQVLPDTLDVLIAERRVDEAIAVLLEGEKVAMDTGKEHAGHASMTRLQALLSERKSRLAEQLMEVVQQPSTCGREVRAAVVGLYRLGDGPRAHTLLLNAHSQKLHYKVQGLRSSTPCYGEAYTSTLSQLVFSALSQAAKDSQSVFGDQAAYMSELVLWASIEVKNFAALVERHVLLPAAATGGLHAAAECVQIALGYCSLLENQGLALCPDLLKLVRPNIEKTLQENMRHIKESVADLVSVDDWIVSLSSGSTGSHISGGLMMQMKLSSSAQRFQMLVQEFFDDVVPLINMQLGGPLLDNCAYLFEYYVSFLIKALPYPDNESLETHMDTRTIMLAEMDHQQLGLLANASALAEEILPRAAAKILPLQQINGIEEARKQAQNTASLRVTELREWRRRLQRTADTLRERYCWKQVIDLIFKDGGANFSVDSYIVLDNDGGNLEPMPTTLFQDLLFKLNKLSYVAADVLAAGRERVTLSILSRVVETFVIFILEDEAFWEGTEEGSKPLGQAGLQQFVLDMHFVIQIASHGHYITRKIRAVVLDIITRAAATFSTAELDPYSFVPEEWFLNAAQDCMHRLLGD